MKIYLLAAAAGAAAIASPAFAGADGPYAGIEGGVTLPQTTDLDIILNNTSVTPNTTATYTNGYSVKSNTGYGIDAIAGLKLGYFRLEAEGGYQRGKVKSVTVSTPLLTDVGMATATTVTAANFPVHDHIGVTKLMANALLDSDFGAGGFGGYVGGGAGRAWTSYTGNSDSSWAYQGIAGLRLALTPNLDAGVKYEYFRTGRLNFADAFTVNSTNFTTSARGHFTSNNILASLVYNFNSREAAAESLPPPPPPPPPPPAAPATQTCPDGSVIDATATCPAPPPPPPPPPPPAQRGERG